MQVEFGTGTMFAAPFAGAPSLTPVPFGVSQDITIDISFTVKQLYGQNQFPVAIGRGEAKISGKCKAAQFSAAAFNGIFAGGTVLTTGLLVALNEANTIAGATYTTSHAATFVDDLGVYYTNTGVFFTKVTSAPAVGQYSVNPATGVYTFNATDNAALINVSYTYTVPSGQFRTTIVNTAMGSAPTFQVVLTNQYQGNQFTLKLYAALSSKLAFGFKNTDFVVPEFDFEAFANAAGQVYDLTVTSL